jgi:ribose-phosphate pyrophosphokinase
MNLYTIHYPDDKDVKFKAFSYPAGESQVRIVTEELTSLRVADEIHVTARITNGDDLIRLALLSDALSQEVFKHKVLILPYLPYARADRRFVDGDCFGLKVFADFINSLHYDQVVTFDVHSKYSAEYINRLENISPIDTIKQVLSQSVPKDSVIILPDAGSITRLAKLKDLDHKILVCEKHRDPVTGAFLEFKVPTAEEFGDNKNAIIVDDLCDAGGTFIGIAELLPKDINLYLYVSHGIFSKGMEELKKHFKKIYTTNSFNLVGAYPEMVETLPIEGYIRSKLLPLEEVWANHGKK